jgi:hypothetical protein
LGAKEVGDKGEVMGMLITAEKGGLTRIYRTYLIIK